MHIRSASVITFSGDKEEAIMSLRVMMGPSLQICCCAMHFHSGPYCMTCKHVSQANANRFWQVHCLLVGEKLLVDQCCHCLCMIRNWLCASCWPNESNGVQLLYSQMTAWRQTLFNWGLDIEITFLYDNKRGRWGFRAGLQVCQKPTCAAVCRPFPAVGSSQKARMRHEWAFLSWNACRMIYEAVK